MPVHVAVGEEGVIVDVNPVAGTHPVEATIARVALAVAEEDVVDSDQRVELAPRGITTDDLDAGAEAVSVGDVVDLDGHRELSCALHSTEQGGHPSQLGEFWGAEPFVRDDLPARSGPAPPRPRTSIRSPATC